MIIPDKRPKHWFRFPYGLRANTYNLNIMWCAPPNWSFDDDSNIEFETEGYPIRPIVRAERSDFTDWYNGIIWRSKGVWK